MNWFKLKENKCPKCCDELDFSSVPNHCICDCGFKISLRKMEQIVCKMVNKDIDEETNRWLKENDKDE